MSVNCHIISCPQSDAECLETQTGLNNTYLVVHRYTLHV